MFLFTVYLDRKCVWNYCVLDAFDPLPGHRRETLSCVSMCRMILGQMSIHSISCSWNQAHVQDFRIISGWWIRFQWLLRCRMPKHWRDLMTPQHPRITLAFCVHCFTQFTYDRNYPRTSLPPILVPRHLLIFFGAARAVWCMSLGLSLGSKLRWAGAQTAQTARTAQTACCSTL